ncbi:macro domain-containing protein [Kineococcus gynurae]|uniref:Macro domain-containing protein n=1 Tax=Kineococcus gynurae TaxID=452979 RepID=A0ABV5LPJ6_9ACTN
MQIEAVRGDIVEQTLDVVVNAADRRLLGGGGVDGAIHRAAGPRLLDECRRLRRDVLPDGLGLGQAVAMPGFDLPARWVVAVRGPNRLRGERDPADLHSCAVQAVRVARGLGADTLALPLVGAGVFGWSPEESARALVAGVRAGAGLELVRFVLASAAALEATREALAARDA